METCLRVQRSTRMPVPLHTRLHVLHILQELFLRSCRPMAALEMRKDLKHWQQALTLAEQLAPASVASISKEHAAMLEMVGEHQQARAHYQQASHDSRYILIF